jgi:hypothetical protein
MTTPLNIGMPLGAFTVLAIETPNFLADTLPPGEAPLASCDL